MRVDACRSRCPSISVYLRPSAGSHSSSMPPYAYTEKPLNSTPWACLKEVVRRRVEGEHGRLVRHQLVKRGDDGASPDLEGTGAFCILKSVPDLSGMIPRSDDPTTQVRALEPLQPHRAPPPARLLRLTSMIPAAARSFTKAGRHRCVCAVTCALIQSDITCIR